MLPDQPVSARNKRTPLLATVWEPAFHEMSHYLSGLVGFFIRSPFSEP